MEEKAKGGEAMLVWGGAILAVLIIIMVLAVS
jgi:hypothetical protein